jgi:hypothetical protein
MYILGRELLGLKRMKKVVLDAHEGSRYKWLIFLTKVEQDDTFRFFIESEGRRRLSFSERIRFCQLLGDRCFIPLLEEKVEDSLFRSLFPSFRIEDELRLLKSQSHIYIRISRLR